MIYRIVGLSALDFFTMSNSSRTRRRQMKLTKQFSRAFSFANRCVDV